MTRMLTSSEQFIYERLWKDTHQFSTLLAPNWQDVVSFIPLTVRGCVNNNDRILHQSLGAHQLIAAGVVHNVNDTGLASDALRAPCKVANVEAERPKTNHGLAYART